MFRNQAVIQAILAAIPQIRVERARRDRLRQELLAFDEESLLRAEAVMYDGRDRDVSFQEKLAYLRRLAEPKDWIIGTLLEKLPACARYFAQAQADLQKEGLSLDGV
jgi:hypothetical protein